MSFNLRDHIAGPGLKLSLEGNFGIHFELIAPDGTEIINNEVGETLKGQIIYDSEEFDPDTGGIKIVKQTEITVRRTVLTRVPLAGEKWGIRYPLDPGAQATLTTQVLNTDKAPEGGQSVGFITLFPKQAEQS